MAAVPADSHAIADRPRGHVGTDGIDHSRNLMAGHARILETGPVALLDEKVAVANAAGGDFYADRAGAGLGEGTLGDREVGAWFCKLYDLHAVSDARGVPLDAN